MSVQLSMLEHTFFLEKDEQKSSVSCSGYVLKEAVQPEFLRQAVEKTVRFFPRAQVKPVITADGKIRLVKNSEPLPVFEEKEEKGYLGSADSNHYLYKVTWSGNVIKVIFSHAMFDGGASQIFLTHLVYYYFSLQGETIPTEGYIFPDQVMDDPGLCESMGEAVARYLQENPELHLEEPSGNAPGDDRKSFVTAPEPELFNTPYAFVSKIRWDNKKFSEAVRSLGTTPFAFISMLISEAIISCCHVNEDEKPVKLSYGYNMRKYLSSRSQCNFTVASNLIFETEWAELPPEEAAAKIRSRMNENGKLEKLIRTCMLYDQYSDMIFGNADIRQIRQMSEKMKAGADLASETFYFANMGKAGLPSKIAEKIDDIIIFSYPTKKIPDYYCMAFGDTGIFISIKNDTDEKIMKKIAEMLQGYGIECRYEANGVQKIDRLDVLKFETEV